MCFWVCGEKQGRVERLGFCGSACTVVSSLTGKSLCSQSHSCFGGTEWLCRLMDSVFQDGQGEEDDEDGASEAASLEEPKEEDQGEGYLSEMDNEPPVSESDDGFSVHNAPLQSHALADSIPSSPASSQL